MDSHTLSIPVEKISKSRFPETDFSNLEFGAVYSDHMFVTDFKNNSWKNPVIVPFGNLTMSPATSVLHYGQTVFEGMKAYRANNGDILIFRPQAHHKRLNTSSRRLC